MDKREAAAEGGDWRIHWTPERRALVVNKILERLNHHARTHGKEVSHGLEEIAKQLEEKVFSVVSSKENYIRCIDLKLRELEGHSQRNSAGSFPSTSNSNEIKDSYPDLPESTISLKETQFPARTSSAQPSLSYSTQTSIPNASGPNVELNIPRHDCSQQQFQGRQEIAQEPKQHVYSQLQQDKSREQRFMPSITLRPQVPSQNVQMLDSSTNSTQLQPHKQIAMQSAPLGQPPPHSVLQQSQSSNLAGSRLHQELPFAPRELQGTTLHQQAPKPRQLKRTLQGQQGHQMGDRLSPTNIQEIQAIRQQNPRGFTTEEQKMFLGRKSHLPSFRQQQKVMALKNCPSNTPQPDLDSQMDIFQVQQPLLNIWSRRQIKNIGSVVQYPQALQDGVAQSLQHPTQESQNFLKALPETRTLKAADTSATVPCPPISMAACPTAVGFEEISGASPLSNTVNFGMHQKSVIPAVSPFTGTDKVLKFVSGELTKYEPMKHLIAAVRSISPKAMKAALCDITAVVQGIERQAGSQPGNGSRAAVGQDLGSLAISQANSYLLQDGISKRNSARTLIPSHYVSFASSGYDMFYQFTGSEISNLYSPATSINKRPRYEFNHALLEDIRKINRQLVNIVPYIMDDNVGGWEGTLVKFSFNAMSFSSNLKAHYAIEMALIQPLLLQVPSSYPNCSPKLLENFPLEISESYDDLSLKTRMRFSASLRSLSEPLSLWDIASTWESCIRAVILEDVQKIGGGSFSSKYGTWDSCSFCSWKAINVNFVYGMFDYCCNHGQTIERRS